MTDRLARPERGLGSRDRWSIAGVCALAAVLYLYRLGQESLWGDELHSVRDAATTPFWDLFSGGYRPLYYALLRAWMVIGNDDTALRVPAVLFAIGAVACTYELGRRLAGQDEALVGSVCLAASPLLVNHAQQVRMYSLACLLAVAGSYALVQALDRPTSFRIALWAAARTAGSLTAPVMHLFWFADAFVVWRARPSLERVCRRFLVAGAAACALLLPSLRALLSASDSFNPGWGQTGVRRALFELAGMPAQLTLRVFADPVSIWELVTLGIVSLLPIAAACFACATRSRGATVLGLWTALPLAALAAISTVGDSVWIPRYALPVLPFLALLAGIGTALAWRRSRTVVLVPGLIYVAAVAYGLGAYYMEPNRQDWRGAFGYVRAQALENEPVWVVGPREDLRLQRAAVFHYGSDLDAIAVRIGQDLRARAEAAPTRASRWVISRLGPGSWRDDVPGGDSAQPPLELWGRVYVYRFPADPEPSGRQE